MGKSKIASILLCLSALYSSSLFAVNSSSDRDSAFYAELGFGTGFVVHHTGVAELKEEETDIFYTVNKAAVQPMLAISAGHQWNSGTTWFPSLRLGLEYNHGFNSKLSGDSKTLLTDTGTYTYKISRDTFLAVMKLGVVDIGDFQPYIVAGLGFSINRAHDFSENNTGGNHDPGFGNNAYSDFAFVAGIGVDYRISDNLVIATEYRYSDYGQVRTGNGNQTEFNSVYMRQDFQAHELLASIRYLF